MKNGKRFFPEIAGRKISLEKADKSRKNITSEKMESIFFGSIREPRWAFDSGNDRLPNKGLHIWCDPDCSG